MSRAEIHILGGNANEGISCGRGCVRRGIVGIGGDGEDFVYQRLLARAYELSGNTLRAAEAYAEVAFLNGRVDDAISQLTTLLKNDDLDYYQRARVEARIAEFMPISLELKRQGIKPEQQGG